MRLRHISQNKTKYDIIKKITSKWTKVEKAGEFFCLTIDEEGALEAIHQDIKKECGECETLSMEDFRKIR